MKERPDEAREFFYVFSLSGCVHFLGSQGGSEDIGVGCGFKQKSIMGGPRTQAFTAGTRKSGVE